MYKPPRLALAGLLLLAACGAGKAAGTPKAGSPTAASPAVAPADATATKAVAITGFAFKPQNIRVPVGTTVTWTNLDEEPHTVVAGGQGIKSPVLGNQGSKFSFTFAKAGTYSYNCSIHPFMHGTVVVTA